jgi:N-acetyl sugar amidotransferase
MINVNNKKNTKVCVRCVMDTTIPDLTFDNDGFCNYCSNYKQRTINFFNFKKNVKENNLQKLISKIKLDGKYKKYDCIIGVSGGVDSSYTLIKAIEYGLRPLAVHMDNGWNSELAQHNIANLINKLNVDLYTHVIVWEEYKNLMQAFFDADVIDIELLYDNAMLAVNYNQAKKFGIKYILAGFNTTSEGMPMPNTWKSFKFDKKNIKKIAKLNNTRIKTFPIIGWIDYLLYSKISKIKMLPFLDYIEYNKYEAINQLKDNYDYKPYPYKHYESVFTRFYQGYILPNKFGVDKRKIHLSTLIMSGQLTRENALIQLSGSPYSYENELQSDLQYFLKKMDWDYSDLEKYIHRPEVPHDIYGSEKYLFDLTNKLSKKIKLFLKYI